MAGSTVVSGRTRTCTEEGYTLGKMVGCMKVNISTTRNTAGASTYGPMAESMLVDGSMASKRARGSTYCQMAKSELESGKTEREWLGKKAGMARQVTYLLIISTIMRT
jgi:hypothetical protein